MFLTRLIGLLLVSLTMSISAMAKIQVTLTPALLKDNSGLVYIGYPVAKDLLRPYLSQLKERVGSERFTLLRDNQAKRDHHSFHITLINPYEYPDVAAIDLTTVPPIRFEFVGLGTASKNADQTYFVVVNAAKAQQVRERFKLPSKDLHVTLGFNQSDVFGVSKGHDSLVLTTSKH